MAWDIESLGGGAITGVITAVLTLLGWRGTYDHKISRAEEEIRNRQTIMLCNARHEEVRKIQEDIKYVRDKIDWLIEKQFNGMVNRKG